MPISRCGTGGRMFEAGSQAVCRDANFASPDYIRQCRRIHIRRIYESLCGRFRRRPRLRLRRFFFPVESVPLGPGPVSLGADSFSPGCDPGCDVVVGVSGETVSTDCKSDASAIDSAGNGADTISTGCSVDGVIGCVSGVFSTIASVSAGSGSESGGDGIAAGSISRGTRNPRCCGSAISFIHGLALVHAHRAETTVPGSFRSRPQSGHLHTRRTSLAMR